MKVLVTGGAGFIGSHVVDALLKRGDKVIVLDDLSYGKKDYIPKAARFIKGSVTNKTHVEKAFAEKNIDAVVHLAAQKNARYSIEDPILDAQKNILGSIYVLEAARKRKVKRFVFASTGGVMYGEADVVPTPESQPVNPMSPYAIAKRSVEYYLRYYSEVHHVSTIALRLANVFGPRQDPKGEAGVVAIFLSTLLEGRTPKIFGKGTQTRDYIYVLDAVDAILRAVDSAVQGHYNIGAGNQISVNQLYAKIGKITGIRKAAKHTHAIPGEQQTSALDAKLAKTALGWSVGTSLEDGLAHTYRWFSERVT